ncbi:MULTISPECIES: hypothetical protein [unclassified Pseudoalteromonas]|uniref:hypothetical protein n=1 Tax=unclassified Pseudoalteromonas TaxID=194690 RepID=UPI0016041CB4|nr:MULTISPECIES: hypothetical protein [unclassified Pseudoalteromonas]MBB1294956.1 hypothetical protein [Pseudoalteromonas sp. SR41-4]MBB1410883.1 hypothetical protein [Pseudoalteromonas sp. SG44-17]
MEKVQSKVESLIAQPIKESFQSNRSANIGFACANGVQVRIARPTSCECCGEPVNVFNVRDAHHSVDNKSSIFHRVIYCSKTDAYHQDIYIVFNYLLGAKLHYLNKNNELSLPLMSFSLPIRKAITFNALKGFNALKRKLEFNK